MSSVPDPEFAARVRRFVDEVAIPLEPAFFERGFRGIEPELARARDEARRLGLFGPALPTELGGQGLSLLAFARVSEELGRSIIGHYLLNVQAPDIGNMELLLHHGSAEQKTRWLLPLARGEIRSCFGMTEPGRAGSNPVWLDTRAVREGEGYRIRGRKWFTSSADGAAFCIVMAVTDPDAPPHRRATQIIVPTDTPGYRFVRNLPVMGERGDGWASHAEIELDVWVPEGHRIGGEGDGFMLAQERLGPGRIHHTMRWIGIAERAFAILCQHVVQRELSPGQPLGSRDVIQSWVAELRVRIDASRLLVLEAAERMERDGAASARDSIAGVKFYVADVLTDVLDRALQVQGARGMLDESPVAWWFRHERGAHIYDGPDEVHKASLGKRILSKYGLPRGEGR